MKFFCEVSAMGKSTQKKVRGRYLKKKKNYILRISYILNYYGKMLAVVATSVSNFFHESVKNKFKKALDAIEAGFFPFPSSAILISTINTRLRS